jgi:cyclopropane fatty-acyl-phospholipid synthase-like methyltransferase
MSEILKKVADYYSEKVIKFGLDSKGVDWNSKESQYLRFEKLFQVVNPSQDFHLLDFGCGTGEFVNFLNDKKLTFKYTGYDISQDMISLANKTHGNPNVSFLSQEPNGSFDYVIGSGIFNVKMGFNEENWHEYILRTLDKFNKTSLKGFAFNILTTYSDPEKRRSDLYYADPLYFFDYCKKNYSRYVTLLHDYPLYEFSIIVRKET